MKNITEFVNEAASANKKVVMGGPEMVSLFTCDDKDPDGYLDDCFHGDLSYNCYASGYEDAKELKSDLMNPKIKWTISYNTRKYTLTFRASNGKKVLFDELEKEDVKSIFQ